METTVKLEYGPASFEIHALEEENYKEELIDLLEFLEENEEKFSNLGSEIEVPEVGDSKVEEMSLEDFDSGEGEEVEEEPTEEGPLTTIASKLKVSRSKLANFIFIDEEGEDYPVLYPEEVSELGERKVDKQRVASLILLYLWHDVYDVDRVKSTELKDALELSDIRSEGMGNMYQGEGDRYFDRRGRGPSATVRLTPPGKRQARKHLKRLLDYTEE